MIRLLLLLFFSFIIPQVSAQKKDVLDEILTDFAAYSELPREVAFVHLNKSVYIKGEHIGFKAYVLDKANKQPSLETRNLYCVLVDSTDRVVKSSMLRIENGIGHGLFELDSLFHTGKYTFRAYTNWMRNFSEPNHFEQPLDILDPETDPYAPVSEVSPGVDVQVLPEGGHAIAGIPSVYGIIIKDSTGYGIPDVEGVITDPDGKVVTGFKVNQFGIGRLRMTPRKGTVYKVRFRYLSKQVTASISAPEPEGVSLQVSDLGAQLGISFRARFKDPARIQAPYFMTIHNGDSIKGVPVDLDPEEEVVKIIPDRDLFPGMNVFTLFDPAGEPLLERLYFHADALSLHSGITAHAERIGDSLQIRFKLPGLDPDRFHSLSVSVLPRGSMADRGHRSLPSHTLLQPYVRGPIQNAFYYFQETTSRTRFELDNLLLTQGWSSYNWKKLRSTPPKYLFDFEKGLSYTVRFNSRSSNSFYVFPTKNNHSQLLELPPGGSWESFTVEGFYPLEGEELAITEIRDNKRSGPFGAFVYFKPSAIPSWKGFETSLLPSQLGKSIGEISVSPISNINLDRLQQLDEIVVVKNRRKARLEKIRDRSRGRVDIFEWDDPRRQQWMFYYLWTQGFDLEGLRDRKPLRSGVHRRVPLFPGYNSPFVYLDGFRVMNSNVLWNFRLENVDYIEFDWGYGMGDFGNPGRRRETIRIFTDPNIGTSTKSISNAYRTYAVPLAFDRKKRYYSPVYGSYNSEFYRAFGVVDWLPDLRTQTAGGFDFKVHNPSGGHLEINVEGIVNGSEFVSCQVPVKIPGDNP